VPTPPEPAAPNVEHAYEALELAHDDVIRAIEGTTDNQRAFEAASHYRELAEQLAKQAADLRAAMAARIWSAESLSLTALASRVGVSKARAAQFLRAAQIGDDPKE
jgi:hypothetical protein